MSTHIFERTRAVALGCLASCLFFASPLATGCATRQMSAELRQRSFTYDPSTLTRDYQEEYRYIQSRRERLAQDAAVSKEFTPDCYERDALIWCGSTPEHWVRPCPAAQNDPRSMSALQPPCVKCEDLSLWVRPCVHTGLVGPLETPDDCDWCNMQQRQMKERACPDPRAPPLVNEKNQLTCGPSQDPSNDTTPNPPHLTGLAFSGGGIRSASFGLGVLQALDATHTLPRLDYMSAVSGGAYLAGWVQAHLGGNQHDTYRDNVYYKVAGVDFHDLLDNNGDDIEHLRTHSEFINRGGFFEGQDLLFAYLWRWPFGFSNDVVLHLKGHNNFHPIAIYEDRIERTYFRGQPPVGASYPPKGALKLTEVNYSPQAVPYPAPYLIINGNLVNGGPPLGFQGTCPYAVDPGEGKPDVCTHYNFEFTRDFTGSDGLGYIQSRAFDRTVYGLKESKDGAPPQVEVEGDAADEGTLPLSYAVAASGAAFDPDGVLSLVRSTWIRDPASWVATPLNLNLGYETSNFARCYNRGHNSCGIWNSTRGYVNMETLERLQEPATDSRWIKITDGGHYENLGVAALARRGVSCIIAIDADADPKGEFGDLKQLRERLYELGLIMNLTPDRLEEARVTGHTRLTVSSVKDPGGIVSTILYLKPNADPVDLAYIRPSTDRSPHHLDPTYLDEKGTLKFKSDATIDHINKIKWYRETRAATDFPHTSTLFQWYDWETFEAYRLLGFQMARTYLPNGADLEQCQFKQVDGP